VCSNAGGVGKLWRQWEAVRVASSGGSGKAEASSGGDSKLRKRQALKETAASSGGGSISSGGQRGESFRGSVFEGEKLGEVLRTFGTSSSGTTFFFVK